MEDKEKDSVIKKVLYLHLYKCTIVHHYPSSAMLISIPQCTVDLYPVKPTDKQMEQPQRCYSVDEAARLLKMSNEDLLDNINSGVVRSYMYDPQNEAT
jgi:hypothetical protein